jgi:hypothetical protein
LWQSVFDEEGIMRKSILGALCLTLVLLAVASPLTAAGNTVLRVVVVQTDNVDGYLKELTTACHLQKPGGTGTIRVWRARFAGDELARSPRRSNT